MYDMRDSAEYKLLNENIWISFQLTEATVFDLKKKISFKIKVIFFEIYICLLYAMKPRYSNLFNFRFNSVCSLCVKKQILTWFYQIWQSDFLHKQNAPTNGIHKTLFFSFNKKKTTFTLKHTQLDFLFLLNYFFFFFCVVSSEKKPEKNSFMIFI